MKTLTIAVLLIMSALNIDAQTARPMAVAGQFYNANPSLLKSELDEYFAKAPDAHLENAPIAIVSPHAGYPFSGYVAAYAYKQLIGKKYDAAVIIAPSHYEYFDSCSIYNGDFYSAPFGNVKIDKDLAKAIGNNSEFLTYSDKGHFVDSARREHSIEVELPFLQYVQPDLPIVPIIMGAQNNLTIDALSEAIYISAMKQNKKVLIIASSDLSHYHTKKAAYEMDGLLLSAFNRYDYYYIETMGVFGKKIEACGGAPIVTALMCAERFGANCAKALKYAVSSDTPYMATDSNKVVGYMAGVIYDNNGKNTSEFPKFTKDDGDALLKIAKNAVKMQTKGDSLQDYNPRRDNCSFIAPVFVTIDKNEQLRGCIGFTITDDPIYKNVKEAAVLASSRDPRFQPVKAEELDSLKYDITVLSRFKRVYNIDDLILGKDGVYMQLGNHTGLFLPQVAIEQKWNIKQFWENLGLKAGANKDAYLHSNVRLYKFNAEIIKDK